MYEDYTTLPSDQFIKRTDFSMDLDLYLVVYLGLYPVRCSVDRTCEVFIVIVLSVLFLFLDKM